MSSTKAVMTPLLELGLNKYEAKVYLTLVSEGTSTAKNISDITGIPYGKVYEIINSLSAKGFSVVLPSKPIKCQAISPKEAIRLSKKSVDEKYDALEKHIMTELEPLFAETKKFVEPKGLFWIINGRANVVKKIDELVKKANKQINIHCSLNSLSRLVLHKELLKDAASRGVKILIAGVTNKENIDEIGSLGFCDIRHISISKNNFVSVDGRDSLIIDSMPDDDNILYGRDLGIFASSASFTRFVDNFFVSSFEKAKSLRE